MTFHNQYYYIHSFSHATNIYLAYVPGIVLGTGNAPVSKTDKNLCPDGSYIPVKQESNIMGIVITGIF